MVVDDGKPYSPELSGEFLLQGDVLKDLSHVTWWVSECPASKSRKHEGLDIVELGGS